MNNRHKTLLAAVAVCAIMLPATRINAATPRPMNITNVSGAARIQQGLPCGNNLDVTTPIVRGYMGISWTQKTRGEVLVDLGRLSMFLSPFHADASCNGVGGAVDFREIGVELASAIRFPAQPIDRDSMVMRFSIPKEKFLIYESVVDGAAAQQTQSRYRRPSADVTGLIDLRRGTVQLQVVLTPELHFRAGCVDGRCAIDEKHTGIVTADIRGGDFSSTPPPSTAGQPGRRTASSDRK
jgi:hypothetical protein